jgi:hypothetical protein
LKINISNLLAKLYFNTYNVSRNYSYIGKGFCLKLKCALLFALFDGKRSGENCFMSMGALRMIIFNGRYSWDGTKTTGREPIAWYPGSYYLKIIDLTGEGGDITHLKPYICIYSGTGEGQSISDNPEKFVKQICYDFSLPMEKVFWVEDLVTGTDRYLVISFEERGRMGDRVFYNIEKRKPLSGELRLLLKELSQFEATV